MRDKEFMTLLQKAVENNENAMIQVIRMYENLVFGNSYARGSKDMKSKIRYFNNPETLEDLKKQYRELAFKHHPDRGREQRGDESSQ